ncbi:hypothetical protein [Streptomyces sp. TP-A0874]|uniref:hypothetical protein n=1 Tax=Streptomyces sp. TP-A0874 TaxID=549819 RepID=UPI0008532227|nr:hypothetical protein [Streptomyces sp. TP-A0874]
MTEERQNRAGEPPEPGPSIASAGTGPPGEPSAAVQGECEEWDALDRLLLLLEIIEPPEWLRAAAGALEPGSGARG